MTQGNYYDYKTGAIASLPSGMTYNSDIARFVVNGRNFFTYEDAEWYLDYLIKFGFVVEGGFDPVSLFASGEEGVWYEPSTTTAFAYTTDLTPCGYGDTCGFLLDQSQGAGYSSGFTGTGSELVTNGDGNSATGWLIFNDGGTSSIVSSGGQLVFTSDATVAYAYQEITTEVGKTYILEFDIIGHSGNGWWRLGTSAGGSQYFAVNNTGSTGPFSQTFVATSTSAFMHFGADAGNDITFDNVSVKELPGNHATQATAASRPILARVPEGGRRNLLPASDNFDTATWSKTNATIDDNGGAGYSDPDGGTGAYLLTEDTTASVAHRIFTQPSPAITARHGTFVVKPNGRNWVYIRRLGDNSNVEAAWFNISTGVVGTEGASNGGTITALSDGWYRISVDRTTDVSVGSGGFLLGMADADNSDTYTGDGSSGIYIYGAQLETGSSATAYQKVVSEYDVTESGVTSLEYLSFDGVDDFMEVSGSSSWVNQHVGTIVTGVLTDSTADQEVFSNRSGSSGKNLLDIRTSATVWSYANIGVLASAATGSADTAYVFFGQGDGTDIAAAVNGEALSPATASYVSQATDLNIGHRPDTGVNHFSGRIYGAIITDDNLSAEERTNTETYLANLSGVTL